MPLYLDLPLLFRFLVVLLHWRPVASFPVWVYIRLYEGLQLLEFIGKLAENHVG